MAVLSEGPNQYTVRILRRPQNTVFAEYVKIGEREKLDARECDRYIVGEPGQAYGVEITIEKGFEWGDYDNLQLGLHFAGSQYPVASGKFCKVDNRENLTKNGIIYCIDRTNVVVSDAFESDSVGAPFTFRALKIDDELSNESNILGVDPLRLGSFDIHIVRYRNLSLNQRASQSDLDTTSTLFQAHRVDARNSKKHGITFATGLDGPRAEVVRPLRLHRGKDAIKSPIMKFHFHYRTQEFLARIGIVKYPPPLHCYSWGLLNSAERKVAFGEIQKINKSEFIARSGLDFRDGYDRKEWRSWYIMDIGERRYAYEKLQKEHKDYERGEVQTQISMVPAHRFIIIDEEGPRIGRTTSSRNVKPKHFESIPSIKQETIKIDADAPSQRSRKDSNSGSETQNSIRHVKIKQEPIDVDALEDLGPELGPAPAIKYDSVGQEDHRTKRVMFERIPEDVDMTMAIASEIKEEDELSDRERWEGEMRSNELERQASVENERARQELAELLSQVGGDIA